MHADLTTGKIGRSLILFSLPMILGNLLQQLYNVADTLIVGQTLGASALAAVGSSYSLMVLLTSVVLGLCMGSGVVFARLYGAKRHGELKTSIFNAFIFIVVISAVLNILAFLLLDSMIVWLNIPAESVEFTREYLRIVFAGMAFVTVYNFISSVLRSIGNTVMPLVFLAAAAVTNIVLDILLIVTFNMGVAGAAVATVAAQGLSAVLITVYFFAKAKDLCPGKSDRHFDKELIKLIVSNSTLTAVQQSIMNLGILTVQGIVNSFGFAASAAFAVVVKIDAFSYMPAQDFGNAFATYVAQNHGAGKSERIRAGARVAAALSVGFCVAVSAVVCIFAEPLMLIFVNPSESAVIGIGVQYLYIVGASYAGIGILFLLYGLYRGMGQALMSIILTVISLGCRVLLAFVLSSIPAIGLQGVWWAVPIGWALADICGVGYYLKKRMHF